MSVVSSNEQHSNPLLIVVHPGSLCGSADFNLGDEAAAAREAVLNELKEWTGDVLVLDSWTSDELPIFPLLDQAIIDAVLRAPSFGERLEDEDPDEPDLAVNHLADRSISLDTPIFLTGAWYHPDDDNGCVNANRDALLAAGYRNVTVMESCAVL